MVHILDEGVPSLSFRLEGVEEVVPYDIKELLGFQKGAPEQVYVHEHIGRFLECDLRRSPSTKKYYPEPHLPSVSLMNVQKNFGENERD
jgi:hypothetical protein